MDLKAIYLTTLQRCAPELLVREHVRADMPRHVVAIGKCAAALLDGVSAVHDVESAFVAVPEGYPLPNVARPSGREARPSGRGARPSGRGGRAEDPRGRAEARPTFVHVGGHPHYTAASFGAGRALLEYVDAHEDLLFLVSGGGSACVEVPLVSEEDATRLNAQLIASGLPIAAINAERRRISAIKGGRLAARVRGRAVTLVYSDVATGALHDVASGPTLPGSEGVLVADNTTLVQAAAQIIGDKAVVVEEQIESDVLDAARFLASRADALAPGEILVAGGEPTVVVRGDGRGGRCSELAVRFAALCPYDALFASSDGVDGNSGVAGIRLRRGLKSTLHFEEALERSDSFAVAAQVGEPIMIAATGNNLRDLFLVARL